MSEARMAAQASETPVARGRALHITLWVAQVLLALAFLSAGVMKLAGASQMVTLFHDIGIGQWLRYVIGVIEIAGAIGLLIPRLSGLAALGLATLMIGATITNIAISYSPLSPIIYLVVAAFIAWGRWRRTRALLGR